jgi:hypothetical protein
VPALKQLLALAVRRFHKKKFKTAIPMFMIHTNHSPSYVDQALSTADSNPSRQSLRSANSIDYLIPLFVRTIWRTRRLCFGASGPAIWNSLLELSHSDLHPALTFEITCKDSVFAIAYQR